MQTYEQTSKVKGNQDAKATQPLTEGTSPSPGLEGQGRAQLLGPEEKRFYGKVLLTRAVTFSGGVTASQGDQQEGPGDKHPSLSPFPTPVLCWNLPLDQPNRKPEGRELWTPPTRASLPSTEKGGG